MLFVLLCLLRCVAFCCVEQTLAAEAQKGGEQGEVDYEYVFNRFDRDHGGMVTQREFKKVKTFASYAPHVSVIFVTSCTRALFSMHQFASSNFFSL